MTSSYIMIDLNDERSASVAEVLNNKTCKRMLTLLAESELSEGDIATKLKIPANTAHYNVHKLIDAGLIEQTKSVLWSVKGKKVATYKVSNKKIVISPKPILRGIVPAVIISGILTFAVKMFFGNNNVATDTSQSVVNYAANSAPDAIRVATDSGMKAAGQAGQGAIMAAQPTAAGAAAASQVGSVIAGSAPQPWVWFLLGAWGALLIFVLLEMRRR
jgi:DNA-binding transcriptional ArsR family regulator